MSINDKLAGKTEKERGSIKANEIKNKFVEITTGKKEPYSFKSSSGRKIEVLLCDVGMVKKNKMIKDITSDIIWMRIKTDGKYDNGDGWYGFKNPPVLVPDGTKKEVIMPDGKKEYLDNFAENLEEALRQMIMGVIK